MQITTRLIASAAFAATALFAAPALAQSAGQDVQANTNVNVRSAPSGTIIDVMRTGERGVVRSRSGNWCDTLRHEGRDGWVYCTYLTPIGSSPRPPRPGPGPAPAPEPGVSFEFSIPGFGFSIGSGGFDRPRPSRPGFGPGPGFGFGQVCFYENTNYRGNSICARPGEQRANLGAWDDRISSIRVTGNAEALVCERSNYSGRCYIVDGNAPALGPRGNNAISSFRVR